MQGKLFQRSTHLLYCNVMSLGGNVNTRRISQPDIGSIFYIKNEWNILVKRNYHELSKLMLFSSSDTQQTLMHLFLFTNCAQRELVSNVRMFIYITLYLYIYLSFYLSIYLSIYLYIYLTNYLSIHISTHLSVHLFIYLSMYLAIYPYMYLSKYMFVS